VDPGLASLAIFCSRPKLPAEASGWLHQKVPLKLLTRPL